MMRASALLILLPALVALTVQAFILPVPAPAHSQRAAPLKMGFFDALKKGFENEELSSPAPNAGLKNVSAVCAAMTMCDVRVDWGWVSSPFVVGVAPWIGSLDGWIEGGLVGGGMDRLGFRSIN
jgi:hypothetical protein